MPKREDRLNPMSRRRGRPPAPPPGPEWMVLGATITCTGCGWVGLETDGPAAIEAWSAHVARAPEQHVDIDSDAYELKVDQ